MMSTRCSPRTAAPAAVLDAALTAGGGRPYGVRVSRRSAPGRNEVRAAVELLIEHGRWRFADVAV
jgi:hypothetical protein